MAEHSPTIHFPVFELSELLKLNENHNNVGFSYLCSCTALLLWVFSSTERTVLPVKVPLFPLIPHSGSTKKENPCSRGVNNQRIHQFRIVFSIQKAYHGKGINCLLTFKVCSVDDSKTHITQQLDFSIHSISSKRRENLFQFGQRSELSALFINEYCKFSDFNTPKVY